MPNEENNNPAESASIRVYIANLGKYNEGELVGGWLSLPQSREKIDEFLRDTVGLELDSEVAHEKTLRGERVYEEYAIHDYEFSQDLSGFTPNISEYTSLQTVNALACLLEQADDFALAAVEAYQQNVSDLDTIEQASVFANFAQGEYPDDVFQFSTKGYVNDEEAFGYYWLYELNPELAKVLEEQNIEGYFDFEAYGEAMAEDGYLHDGIYLGPQCNIYEWSTDYDITDIQEILSEQYGEDYFQSAEGKNLWDEREALGKKHGFELELDLTDDGYFYCRTFRPEEGKDINTIVEYDTEKQQWKAYTVDYNQPEAHGISEAIYRSDLAGAFAMGNSLYAEICEMADVLRDAPERFRAAAFLPSLRGFERTGEGSFVKQFEVFDAVNPQIMNSYETEVSWDDEQKQWEVCTTNLDTGKTEDVLWEAEIKDALKEADDQVREIVDGSFFRDRTLQQQSEERISDREHGNEAHEEAKAPKRASSLAELAARGREKAHEHNKNLKNNNQDLKKKQVI